MNMEERFDHLEQTLADHITFSDHNQKAMNGKMDKLINAVFGDQQIDIDGETFRKGGLVALAATMEHRATNGGVNAKIKWSRGQKIAIFAFITPSVVTALIAIFGK